MTAALCPAVSLKTVQADENIGSVTVNGETKVFTSLGSLTDYVEDLAKKTFVIEMFTDWGDERLIIPEDSNATFNMNGHVYDRGLRSEERNGEVIEVSSGACLTVNGLSQSGNVLMHSVPVYRSTSYSASRDFANLASVRGGVIAGGYCSNGGGGMDINDGCTVTLNDVTIAGCRAEQTYLTDGYGGGIWIHGEKATLNMVDSRITGCYAYNDGGGIYEDNENGLQALRRGPLCAGHGGRCYY